MNNEPNISLYGDGTGEDFPVLKAFQQYIDAEQAKARRRLLTVSIVFVVALIAVIAIFSMMVIKANERTQITNDKMFELLMKDKDRSVEDAKSAAVQELTIKNFNDTLEKLQKQLEEKDRKAAEAAAAAAKELAAAKAAAAESPSSDPALDKRTRAAEARIQKALDQLKAEKKKLAEEKEKQHQEEIERYRRKYYPEYYAEKEAAQKAALTLDDLDDELDEVTYFDDYKSEPERPAAKSAKPVKKPAAKAKKAVDLDEMDPIEYFKDADSYTIPVEVKGKRAGWRVPLD